MKTNKVNRFSASLFSVATILFTIFFLPSCASKVAFKTSDVVPAAQGSVKVKSDKNNNHKIELNIVRLADPKRLSPPKDTYVVWMDTKQNGTKNLGQLKTSSGLFSKTLKSSLETVTSFKPTRFIVTAENNANIQRPAGQIVLRTEPF